jgi:hypothetical protein
VAILDEGRLRQLGSIFIAPKPDAERSVSRLRRHRGISSERPNSAFDRVTPSLGWKPASECILLVSCRLKILAERLLDQHAVVAVRIRGTNHEPLPLI